MQRSHAPTPFSIKADAKCQTATGFQFSNTLKWRSDRVALEEFAGTWRLHNPLKPEQLPFAGHTAAVQSIGYYHGGDVLYVLQDVPSVWHEVCKSRRRLTRMTHIRLDRQRDRRTDVGLRRSPERFNSTR